MSEVIDFNIFFVSWFGIAWADSGLSCQLPMIEVYLSSVTQASLPEPALPVLVTQITQNGGSVSTAVSMMTAVGPTQVAQNARSGLTLDLLACDEGSPVQEGPLGWAENPTQLALGGDWLQYHFGAVLGNWALMSVAVAIWSGVAYKMGPDAAQFPGSLILPVLFLVCPTIASSVTLLRDGGAGQQTTGAVSILLSLAGAGAVGVMMHPKFFKARWDTHEQEWVDLTVSKSRWVAQYGELFETYGSGRQWYIVIELLTSMAVGTLKSYQVLEQNCGQLLWAGVGVYDAYALSQLALRPNRNRHVQILYTGVAGLQALALTTQAIASVATSQETQDKVKTVTQSIVTVTEYLMMIKTLFDIGLRFKSWYDRFYGPKAGELSRKISRPATPVTPPSTPLQASLQEMLLVPVLPMEEPLVLSGDVLSLSSSASSIEISEPTPMVQSQFLFGRERSSSVAARTLNEALEELFDKNANL